MFRDLTRVVLVAAGVALCANSASGAWTSNPGLNTVVANRPSGQTLPKIAVGPDNSTWISWFDPASGNYDVYIQRLDPFGNEVFLHNGALVSNIAQPSSLVDYDMTADSAGGAVVAFTEAGVGSDRDARATRILADGTMAWSASLSNDANFEADPRVLENSLGDIIVIWVRSDANKGIFMQRLDRATGAQLLAPGGLRIAGDGVEGPAFAEITPAENGNFIMAYIRDTRTFTSPRHVFAQKYDRNGAPLWNAGAPLILENVISVPVAHRPRIVADGAGRAVFAWHDARTGAFNAWVQRATSAGAVLMPVGGAQVVVNPANLHLDPAISYDAPSDSVIVFLSERDGSQGVRGIVEQRLSTNGSRLWTDPGKILAPFDGIVEDFIRGFAAPGGAVCCYFDQPGGIGTTQARVLATRVNLNGDPVWPGAPRVISSVLSDKGRLPVVGMPSGGARLAWEDNRSVAVTDIDIYAQNLNADGSIGVKAGDLNGDKIVNAIDLALLLGSWGICHGPAACPADLNGDGFVGAPDLALLLGNWG